VSFVVSIDDMQESLPLARRRVIVGAVLLAVVVLVGGRHLLNAGTAKTPQRAEAAASVRAQASPRLVVHVVGAVRRPGLYRLSSRSRTADAVERAGGATAAADLSLVNLAAPVSDGTQVVVPTRAPPAGAGAPAATGQAEEAVQGPVHLNTATLEQLDALPGVGPVTAQKILDYRERHGAFSSLDDLDAIPGIGPARLEQLREVAAP
jgi:competence protein ComEA